MKLTMVRVDLEDNQAITRGIELDQIIIQGDQS